MYECTYASGVYASTMSSIRCICIRCIYVNICIFIYVYVDIYIQHSHISIYQYIILINKLKKNSFLLIICSNAARKLLLDVLCIRKIPYLNFREIFIKIKLMVHMISILIWTVNQLTFIGFFVVIIAAIVVLIAGSMVVTGFI